MKKRWLLVMIVLLVVSLACESSGTSAGASRNCTAKGNSGSCEGRYKKISGTISDDFSVKMSDDVVVELAVSVESGRVRVWFESPTGEEIAAEAAPGSPASLIGVAVVEGSFDEYALTIHFEALDEEVTGITYELNYKVK